MLSKTMAEWTGCEVLLRWQSAKSQPDVKQNSHIMTAIEIHFSPSTPVLHYNRDKWMQ